ncbi:isoleucyl-tRNA synthetase [Gloeobacter kilaueensis JS1]|uniref:Isoleucine--tRNA ligase n=2 Tax=Gloeobacter TaxID=33071 RepID=U5QRM4_GLOK1|nr:isoleucine--tRNA ligase [Gloeobacter kilaueensis]AGY60330.1 isoleucyl-tRNA synthetase [Gloeobacter kilaueensis JS1]
MTGPIGGGLPLKMEELEKGWTVVTQTTEPGTARTDYKDTVRTPKTDFPMRANAASREVEIQRFWEEQDIYRRLAQNNPGEVFILHDGPPYANGDLHIGHALNKILKDIINRYQILQGRRVRYVPGWDCHGLPIELKVLQNLSQAERSALTPLELRVRARDFALRTVDTQRAGFKRYGVWGDWDDPYLTLQPEYEAAQIGVFGKMALKGYIYRGLKPVHWSPSSQSALAEAELEYPTRDDGSPAHTSRSVYVRFALRSISQHETATVLAAALLPRLEAFHDREEELIDALMGQGDEVPAIGVAIWTTTPWTLPGNLAICLNAHLDYAVVESPEYGLLVVASDLVDRLATTLGTSFETIVTFKGQELENSLFEHPLYHRTSPIVLGDHVTTDTGTGAVHTAPGHGSEDFEVAQHYGLGVLSPVDDYGRFTREADSDRKNPLPVFAGKAVLGGANLETDGNQAVIDAVGAAGALLKEEAYVHKYPYDWRTKKPTIFRATTQWFASVSDFRPQALAAVSQTQWVPASGENRITAMVAGRNDWCISRQRAWGLPIPAFYCENCGNVLLTAESIEAVQLAVRTSGSDIWWQKEANELLPADIACVHCGGTTFRKEKDIMDVWFDSGSSWAGVLGRRPQLHYPADIYLEGSDQHRGWFQSSLLTCVATEGFAPYKSVLTHGFTLDEQGRKMSKSLGNVVDPKIVIEGGPNLKQQPAYGADVLRLWVASVDYTSDQLVGASVLAQIAEVYRKIRNTARYLLGSLSDFVPERDAVGFDSLQEVDHYLLHRLSVVVLEITEAFEAYQFSRFFQVINQFCTVDLSNFYFDISKDRLYISAENAVRRRSCQTVLYHALESISRLIAPAIPHLAEDIWQYLPYPKSHSSIFEAGWPTGEPRWYQPQIAEYWEKLVALRNSVNAALETKRNAKAIGSSLEAKVKLYVADAAFAAELARQADQLRYLFIVSQVELLEEPSGDVAVIVEKADGKKCARCWNYSEHVGEDHTHPELCERCTAALAGAF